METSPKAARIGLEKKLLFALLLAFLLSPLIVLLEYARSRYRAHQAREIWGDIQTIRVDTSSYADVTRVVERHKEYWKADGGCTPADCVWRFEVLNGHFYWLVPLYGKNKTLDSLLSEISGSDTFNYLGIRIWRVSSSIHVRDDKVWFLGAGVIIHDPSFAQFSAHVLSVRDPPEDVTPYINHVTGLYDRQLEGDEKFSIRWYAGMRGVRYSLAKSAPDEIRREAFDLDLRCLDSLRGCEHYGEFAPSAWARAGEELTPGWWHSLFRNPTRGRIPNKTILAAGIIAFALGVGVFWVGTARRASSRRVSFILIALGLLMTIIGATSIYVVEVAEEYALWVWPVSALLCAVLVEYGPKSPSSTRWRIALFGALALFLASLLGTLGTKGDMLGILLVTALLSSWVAVAKCRPGSRVARAIRGISFLASAICAASFYSVSRTWDTILDGSRYSVMTFPFGWDIRLPRPYDFYILGQGFRFLLLVSIPVVSLCSVAYLWKWWIDTRSSVAAGRVATVALRQPSE